MKSIKIEEWGGYEFFFDPREVEGAETDGEVLECLRHENGNQPYSAIRCAVLVERPEGKELAQEIRRLCEGKRDKGKSQKNRRSTKISRDPEVEV